MDELFLQGCYGQADFFILLFIRFGFNLAYTICVTKVYPCRMIIMIDKYKEWT
jgi:hypothetical protein